MPRALLFLCTGNYYRSRFAEMLFNHLAVQQKLDWKAESRALAVELSAFLSGPISPHTLEGLKARGCPPGENCRKPIQVSQDELAGAERVIALKEAEHRPLLAARYPGWEDRVEYWHIHDLDGATPAAALQEIDLAVRALVDQLAAQADAASTPTRIKIR